MFRKFIVLLPIIAFIALLPLTFIPVTSTAEFSTNKDVIVSIERADPRPPINWSAPRFTWSENPLQLHIYTLDGKPISRVVNDSPPINWSELPFPPLEERDDYRRGEFAVVSIIMRSENGSIIWACNNCSSNSLDPLLPPGEYWYDINVTLPRDGKDHVFCYFILNATGTGEYILHFRMTFINPYDKWNHLVGWVHHIGTDSTAVLKTGDILDEHRIWYPAPVVVPRETLVCYQYVDYNFTVTETGTVKFYFESHCIITDINGDGKVSYEDLFMVAGAYGAHLDYGINDENYPCDMDCDLWIDFEDLHLVTLDYGKTISP